MPYNYSWNDPQLQTSEIAFGLCSGQYLLTVTDANNCIAFANGIVGEPEELSLTLSSVPTECGNSNGSAWAVASGGTAPYGSNWIGVGPGDTINGLDQQIYLVEVSDNNGCTANGSVEVGSVVATQEICAVTVTENGKNQVNWSKPIATNVAGYNIYRNIAGVYNQVGYKPYDSLSFFVDETFGIDPSITSYRYKISVVDTCGNEGELSAYHETIHLTSSVGVGGEVNLIWDDYEGFGFGHYIILRDSTSNGDWQVLDSVPFTNFTYTDFNVPSSGANYAIEVSTPSLCEVTRAIGDLNSSRSNRSGATISGPTSIDDEVVQLINLYPNPAHDKLNIVGYISGGTAQHINVYDYQGNLVFSQQISEILSGDFELNLTIDELAAGYYILDIITSSGSSKLTFAKH